MKANTLKLLGPATNYAVVQLPERQFPGVVFQGDSLHGLVQSLTFVIEQLSNKQVEMAVDDLIYIKKDLLDVLHSYEKVCKASGCSLPYVDTSEISK